MSSRWWRAYDDALNDPKVQRLPPHLFKTWFNLLCIASKHDGRLPKAEDIAFLLRRRVDDVRRDVAELCARRLFDVVDDAVIPHNWDIRQYRSDLSTQRVKVHRKRSRNVAPDVARNVSETSPDTDTDTEQISEAKASAPVGAVDIVDEDPKAKLFRVGKTTLVSFGITEKRTGSLIGQWLKTRNDPEGLLAAIQFARDHNVAEPVAYISTLVSGKGKANGHGKQSLSELAFELADEMREHERTAGIGRSPPAVGGH